MRLFVDASALTSIVVGEADADALTLRIEEAVHRMISGIVLWETAVAVARVKQVAISEAWADVGRFVTDFDLQSVNIGAREAEGAARVHGRYGKRSDHPARLNMGDCFAYACAKTNGARLLYKGDDFARTDLA